MFVLGMVEGCNAVMEKKGRSRPALIGYHLSSNKASRIGGSTKVVQSETFEVIWEDFTAPGVTAGFLE
jgi:hypothetical protein